MEYEKATRGELLKIVQNLKMENDSFRLALDKEICNLIEADKVTKKKENRLREVLENSLDAGYKLNLKTLKYEYFSPAFTRLSGYMPNEFLNLPYEIKGERLIHPDDISKVDQVLTDIFSSDSEFIELEYRFKCKDGQYRWFLDKFRVIRDKTGDPVALIGSISDIHTRKLAENSLWQSEEKYRNLAENLSELIFQADPVTTRAIFVNGAIEKIYGYSVEEWLSDPTIWVNSIYPEDKERVLTEYGKAQAKHEDLVISYRIIRKDEAVRLVEARTSWIKNEQGDSIGINGIIYDITAV